MATYNGDAGNNTLVGSSSGDFMQGGGGNDTVQGAGGNDTISGNEGTDWVAGGAGNDTVAGGSGQDSFAFSEYGATNADLLTDFDAGWDNLQLDAAAFGAIGATGRFSAGDARFYSGTAAHDADDRIIYDSATGQLFYDADGNGAGAAQLIATVQNHSSVRATDIWVYGNSAPPPSDQYIVGTPGDDHLVGGPGNDTLDGLAGTDTLEGGAGNDTYINGEVIIDSSGIDTVIATPNNAHLDSGLENLIVRGNSTAPERDITGNELDNRITNEATGDTFFYITGGAGNDTLIGGEASEAFLFGASDGRDTVDAGAGFNWLFLSGAPASADFRAGTATVGSTSVSFANIDAAQGSSFNDLLIADDAGRVFNGGAGNDTLTGGAGDDQLLGDALFAAPADPAGNDVLEGGAGRDTLGGGSGADLFRFTAAPGAANADVITDFASASDRIELDGRAMPALGPSGAFSSGDARFYAGAAAHDADDRVIYNNATGDLFYDADGSGASVQQLIATLQGAPTLNASDITVANGSVTPPPPPPTTGQNLSGTNGNDTLVGGAGNDTIYANSGNDWIEGGGGNDRLSGGSGQDSYVFREYGAANADTLANFDGNNWDSLRFDNSVFTALGGDGRFASNDPRFYAGASAHDADDRIIYNGGTGQLYYDADGNGAGGAELVATLPTGSTVVASDLWVV